MWFAVAGGGFASIDGNTLYASQSRPVCLLLLLHSTRSHTRTWFPRQAVLVRWTAHNLSLTFLSQFLQVSLCRFISALQQWRSAVAKRLQWRHVVAGLQILLTFSGNRHPSAFYYTRPWAVELTASGLQTASETFSLKSIWYLHKLNVSSITNNFLRVWPILCWLCMHTITKCIPSKIL